MIEMKAGMPVRSKAGHDKGHWYLILYVEGSYVWLVDGRTRKKERPKKKNARHVQPAHELADIAQMDDGAIVAYLKEYNKSDREEKA